MLQALANQQNLIENRAVTSCLPSSPLRTNFNPAGNVFNFPYQQSVESSLELMQRLQSLGGFNPQMYNYQTLPFMQQNLYNQQPLLNNNYSTLQPVPKKLPQSPLTVRHSFADGRNSEPRQLSTPTSQYHSHQNLSQFQSPPQAQIAPTQHLQVQQNVQRAASPKPQESEATFIKPLSQMGTLTTTDSEGRVRVIVPVPSNSGEDAGNLMASLRISDDSRPITRSTSEKVPNRSELMSQVQRTTWARHTTK